ncbi:unnamed protein product [Malus baccata var. baccata]
MGNTEKLMNQIMELKFTSKSLQRQSRKCENEEKAERLKIKKAMEKGNVDSARIYAENAIRKRTEQMNYLRLASRLDAVVARLDTQAKMFTINKSMGNIVSILMRHSEAISLFLPNTLSLDSSSSSTIRACRHAQHHSITFCAHTRTSWPEATRGSSGSHR